MSDRIFGSALAAGLAIVMAVGLCGRPANAADQSGEKFATIWKSTYTATTETSSTTAKTGGVLGSVNISSAIVGNAAFIVYDSSDATTSGKEVMANISCMSVGSYWFNVAADLGLSYATTGGCKVTMTFLDHR